VRAVTRIAEPQNEKKLLDLARHATTAQVEKLVRAYRSVGRHSEREHAAKQYASRELNNYYDEDGSLVIRARLPAAEGAVVLQALNAAMDARHAKPNEAESDDVTAVTSEPSNRFAQRRADALTTLAETSLRHGPTPLSALERYQVVVHVTAETLAKGDASRCELENGPGLALDTVRRITCDGSLLQITEDGAGNPLHIGRKTRAVPPAMQRALRSRDGGCRFPGCTNHRFVDAHHIRHWADGGETSLDNLVLLCRRHHRLVHERGFGVKRVAGGALRFSRPDGCIIEEHPRLPATDDAEGLLGPTHRRANRETGGVIDASSWIIPGYTLDYGMATEALLRKGERNSRGYQADR